MGIESIANFSQLIQKHLCRTEWRDFPDIIIHSNESSVKKHLHYAAAKAGDVNAAQTLVWDTINIGAVEKICELIGETKPYLLAVHAVETEGRNAIPLIMAHILSKMLGLQLDIGIIQINMVSHTGADGYTRLAFPALFDGIVQQGKCFLIDDFIGQGGTLANLKGFLENCGAQVIGATTLIGKAYSAKLKLNDATLQTLKEKHGNELERWWIDTFGYSFEKLTESEARYLTRADDVDSITARIVAARRKRDRGIS